jgi:hypothetical protein
MARIYTVTLDNLTVTAAGGDTDLLSIDPATDKPVELIGWDLMATSEVGDAAEEIIRLKVIHGHTTVGSGGAAATARPLDVNDSAFGGSVRVNDTTIASAGTAVDLYATGMNERIGHQLGPLPDGFGFRAAGAAFLVVRMMSTVADDISLSGVFWIREL